MTIRSCVALAAVAAALFGVAAPARADNVTLLAALIKWSAVIEKDAGALGAAANKGPDPADAAALKLKSDALAATSAIDAIKPSSTIGSQIRDQVAIALRNYQLAGQELHLAVVAAKHNDIKRAQTHSNKAVSAAQTGGSQLTQTVKLFRKLKA